MPNPSVPQALDDRLKGGLADYVESEIRKGIEQSFGAITDPAGFLASTAPAPATLGFARGLTRQVCRAWARGSTPIQGPAADGLYGPLCNPYLRTINEDPSAPFLGPGAVDGQCAGVAYDIAYNSRPTETFNCNTRETNKTTGAGDNRVGGISFTGPITALYSKGKDYSNCGYLSWVLVIGHAGGTTEVQLTTVGSAGSTNNRLKAVSTPGLRAVRVGGGVSCGNAPPVYLPPATRPGLPTLPPYTPGDDAPGVPPVSISIDPDGNINVSIPDAGLDFNIDVPKADPVTGDVPPGAQGTPGAEGSETATGDEGEDNNRNLVGILVRLKTIPPRANALFNNDGVIYKGPCFVYFGGDGGLALNSDALFCRSEQFFYAPEGSNRWRVIPNVGYSLSVQPFYRE